MTHMKTTVVKIKCSKRGITKTAIYGKECHMLGFPSSLHFGENTTGDKSNTLMKGRTAVQYIHLNDEFKTVYVLEENVAISKEPDEVQVVSLIYPAQSIKIH
jgi:hypothetical protein